MSAKGAGFRAQIDPGTLQRGSLSQLALVTKPGAKITYSVHVTFLTNGSKPADGVPILAKAITCLGPVALTVKGTGTFTFVRTADKKGNDRFCIGASSLPAKIAGLSIAMTVQVTAGKTKYATSPLGFSIIKVLGLKTSSAPPVVFPGGVQTVKLSTEPGTLVSYQIPYAGKGGSTLTVKRTVPKSGSDSVSFTVNYTPSRAEGMTTAHVSISGAQGIIKGGGTAAFMVLRKDAVLVLKKLTLKVAHPTIGAKAGMVQSIDTVSARYTYMKFTVSYNKVPSKISYAVVADGSGFATLRVPITVKLKKGAKASALVTITATQGKTRITKTAAFTVVG